VSREISIEYFVEGFIENAVLKVGGNKEIFYQAIKEIDFYEERK
jgi:hypothetical protein